ncbi:hypothetical protein LX32DRAFT_217121 [Colletotrichum zoysiae]|uniref:Uncharacterized protein n=1 Tax=Colletotrichum zoysiae TaxID=1216348 RepID=A0AAD9HN87_9PEZI|nr:hypothetical protein LX32DRAFT_217121 [Colletotrichum zoysiae]
MSTCSRSGEPFHSGISLPSGPDASLALFRLYHPYSFSCNRRFTRTCSRVPTSYGTMRLGHCISQNTTPPPRGRNQKSTHFSFICLLGLSGAVSLACLIAYLTTSNSIYQSDSHAETKVHMAVGTASH